MLPPTDQELFLSVQNEESYQAFEELFNRYYDDLCIFSFNIVENWELAEEVVLDVFFKVWRNRSELYIKHSFKSYLYKAAKHQAIDYVRKNHKRPMTLFQSKHENNRWDYSPEEMMIYAETQEHINAGIDKLPKRGKHTFKMSREEGLKYKDIAKNLNLSIKTVETHMRRSLISLRDHLNCMS